MPWLDGLPGLLGVIGVAIIAGAIAIVLAKVLRVDRLFSRLGGTAGPTAEQQLQLLSELADVAHREGVLALEARVATLNDDFLARAVAMAVDGTPADEIRRSMEAEIDSTTLTAGSLRSAILRLARYPQAGTIAGAATLLAVMAVYGADPQLAGGAAVAGLGLFLIGIGAGAVIGPVADRLAGQQAALVMGRLLQTEAMALIRTGCDGRTVAFRLRSMLPSRAGLPIPAAKAA